MRLGVRGIRYYRSRGVGAELGVVVNENMYLYSMKTDDIRWEQRLENYNKAMQYLADGVAIQAPDMLQKAGIIQLFEISFELAWKLLKDYLEEQGFVDINTPRSAIKKAFEIGLIQDGHVWLSLLNDRNLTTHTYDEAKASALKTIIANTYFPIMETLRQTMNQKQHGS